MERPDATEEFVRALERGSRTTTLTPSRREAIKSALGLYPLSSSFVSIRGQRQHPADLRLDPSIFGSAFRELVSQNRSDQEVADDFLRYIFGTQVERMLNVPNGDAIRPYVVPSEPSSLVDWRRALERALDIDGNLRAIYNIARIRLGDVLYDERDPNYTGLGVDVDRNNIPWRNILAQTPLVPNDTAEALATRALATLRAELSKREELSGAPGSRPAREAKDRFDLLQNRLPVQCNIWIYEELEAFAYWSLLTATTASICSWLDRHRKEYDIQIESEGEVTSEVFQMSCNQLDEAELRGLARQVVRLVSKSAICDYLTTAGWSLPPLIEQSFSAYGLRFADRSNVDVGVVAGEASSLGSRVAEQFIAPYVVEKPVESWWSGQNPIAGTSVTAAFIVWMWKELRLKTSIAYIGLIDLNPSSPYEHDNVGHLATVFLTLTGDATCTAVRTSQRREKVGSLRNYVDMDMPPLQPILISLVPGLILIAGSPETPTVDIYDYLVLRTSSSARILRVVYGTY